MAAAGVSTGTGCAANVLSNVLCSLWNKVVEEVKLVISLPRAITRMNKEVATLENEIYDINTELGQQQRSPKRIVKTWLDDAGEAIETSRSIGNKYQTYQQHRKCIGCCPNCLSRYKISKEIRDWELNVAQLHSQKQSKFPPSGEYGDPTPRPEIPIQNPEPGFVADAMRSEQMELLVKWLTDQQSNTRRIGVHGMGGVGKTSLLDAINDSPEVRNSFDLIIRVTISRNNMLDLQKCVADRLKLKNVPDNHEGRKDMLRSYLKNKRVLLLLDDMWADDMWTCDKLQNLGVSLNDTGFKLVLTTRDLQVCATMNVEQRIRVEPLLENEGWELFRSRAFQNGNVPEDLEEVAMKIAKECKGLPLAIIVVAAAMTNHSYLYEWEVALDQLRNVDKTFYDLHPGVDTELFQRLKWSYNVLPDYLKTCFLYFAAYPEDRAIYCTLVIDMWIAVGLVKGSGDSCLQDTGHSYISHLRDRCLIEVVDTDSVGRIYRVKIHDVLRALAIRIAETEQYRCYFKAGQGVSHFPIEEEGWARMSLMYNHLSSLPTTFAYSSLSVLLLSENPDIREVPESFLSGLPSLKVLDLSETGITSLPPCIGNLKHLASLQLYHCKGFCELPESICDLNNLQSLNVGFCSQLLCLPEKISKLERLRVLDIKGCIGLSHLPSGMSELVSLESLEMLDSNISLDFEEDANDERKYVCLKDLQRLSRLKDLSVKIKSPVKEGVIGKWSKMRVLYLDFRDANQDYLPQDMQAMKDLESFCLEGCDVERLPSWVSEFRRLAAIQLWSCGQLKEFPTELQELPCLRELYISGSDKLKELELGMGFPKLEKLTLGMLDSLECVGAVAASSGSRGSGKGASPLPMLKSLEVRYCEKLKTLRGEWDQLKCLEEIKGQKGWWDAIQWEEPNMKTSLEGKYRRTYY